MATMAEREIASDTAHTLTKSESDASQLNLPEDAPSDTEFEEKGEVNAETFGDVDDFGGFGDELQGAGANDDDFGDFNDFDDIGSTDDPAAKTPPPRPLVESVLSLFEALFESPPDHTELLDVLEKSMVHGFGTDAGLPEVVSAEPAQSVLLEPSKVDTAVSSMLAAATAEPTGAEPRLVKNLLLVAASSELSETYQAKLLTPLSELNLSNGGSNTIAKDAGVLELAEIRQLATHGSESLDTSTGIESLIHALKSLNVLVAAKEQDAAKRRDAVDAYNHVIQTLVAQATKLH